MAWLYLQVSDSGSKSWIFRYTLNGKNRHMGLGPFHTVSLADACHAAVLGRQSLLKKIGPISARDAEHARQSLVAARSMTFLECGHCVHQNPPLQLEKRKACRSVGKHDQYLLWAGDWTIIRTKGRYRYRYEGDRADLDGKPKIASRLRGRIESVKLFETVTGRIFSRPADGVTRPW